MRTCLMILLLTCGFGCKRSDHDPQPEADPWHTDGLSVLGSIEPCESNGEPHLCGTVENRSGRSFSEVRIGLRVLDAGGLELGFSGDITRETLHDGGQWIFHAPLDIGEREAAGAVVDELVGK